LNRTPSQFEWNRWQEDFRLNTVLIHNLLDSDREIPKTKGWSPAQCVDHLRITVLAFIPRWQAVAKDPPMKAPGGYAFWWKWFLGGVANPTRMKSGTAPSFEPAADLALTDVAPVYLELREHAFELAQSISASGRLGVPVRSPFASWMKYAAGFSLDLWLAHESRHLTQAENALSRP
jgi:hypothetical protein